MSWDGKMYDKYRIEHTNGTPLKGKKYFVLRLDSEDPVEAARVAAAMRAYKNEPRNCDVGTVDEQEARFDGFCMAHKEIQEPGLKVCSDNCPFVKKGFCELHWAQMPYEESKAKGD